MIEGGKVLAGDPVETVSPLHTLIVLVMSPSHHSRHELSPLRTANHATWHTTLPTRVEARSLLISVQHVEIPHTALGFAVRGRAPLTRGVTHSQDRRVIQSCDVCRVAMTHLHNGAAGAGASP